MFLCVCKGIRVSEAVDAAKSGAKSPKSLIERFGFEDAECCGRCARDIDDLVVLVTDELEKSRLKNRAGATSGQGQHTAVPTRGFH